METLPPGSERSRQPLFGRRGMDDGDDGCAWRQGAGGHVARACRRYRNRHQIPIADIQCRPSHHVRACFALGNLYPGDKVPPAALTGEFIPRSLNADSSLTLEVSFQPSVTYDRALQLLAGLDATAEQPALLSGNRLTVRLPQHRVLALLALDDVAWVEDREAPKTGSNSGAAALSHINSLWQPPLQLSGAGVVAGMWDEGLVDVSHPELAGHVVQGESGQVVGHATHVAGTFVGSGAGNPAARGMAPGVSLRSYDFYGDPVGEQTAVRNATGMALTNNSWGYLAGWQSNYYGDGYWTWFGGAANRSDP